MGHSRRAYRHARCCSCLHMPKAGPEAVGDKLDTPPPCPRAAALTDTEVTVALNTGRCAAADEQLESVWLTWWCSQPGLGAAGAGRVCLRCHTRAAQTARHQHVACTDDYTAHMGDTHICGTRPTAPPCATKGKCCSALASWHETNYYVLLQGCSLNESLYTKHAGGTRSYACNTARCLYATPPCTAPAPAPSPQAQYVAPGQRGCRL